MNKGLSAILALAFAGLTLLATFFMPWAEMGFLTTNKPDDVWGPLVDAVNSSGFASTLQGIGNALTGSIQALQHDPNVNYYIYSVFLALALVAAGIAIGAIGREDAEEKTVLPSK